MDSLVGQIKHKLDHTAKENTFLWFTGKVVNPSQPSLDLRGNPVHTWAHCELGAVLFVGSNSQHVCVEQSMDDSLERFIQTKTRTLLAALLLT
jgi:hypothetical protein